MILYWRFSEISEIPLTSLHSYGQVNKSTRCVCTNTTNKKLLTWTPCIQSAQSDTLQPVAAKTHKEQSFADMNIPYTAWAARPSPWLPGTLASRETQPRGRAVVKGGVRPCGANWRPRIQLTVLGAARWAPLSRMTSHRAETARLDVLHPFYDGNNATNISVKTNLTEWSL